MMQAKEAPLQINAEMVKQLRQKTAAGIMDCKEALTKTCGDVQKAYELLQAKGFATAEKKSQRVANQGVIEAYIHPGGRIGSLVELNCESDFVARTDEFKCLAHDLAMQVAAMSPQYLAAEDVPAGSDVVPGQACLLLQPFIKDPTKSIRDVITEVVAKVGENIKIRRFTRFELGL
jgi:elongation factor Ts